MAQHKVIDLINQFMEDHGQSSGKDRVMLWLEDVYQKIRRLPWSWNFRTTDTQTGGGYASTPVLTSDPTTETFSYTQGYNYIVSSLSTVDIVSGYHTGRYVYLGEEWYKCTRIAPVGATNHIYLDKKIVAAAATGQTLSFYRRDLSFETNGIKSLHIDDQKIEHLTGEQIYRFKRGLDPRWYYGDAGTPLAYYVDDYQIRPPMYAPLVALSTDSSSTATFGTHRAFYTFYDYETGLESAPGPTVEFTYTTTLNRADFSYRAPGEGHSGETTYGRRLYISKVVGAYTRTPAWNDPRSTVGTATALFTSALFSIYSDSLISEGFRYYDGEWTRTVLYPAPDEYLRAHARHIDTWSGLPENEEIIRLGRQREFIELFHLYFLMKQSIQNKDPKQFREMQGSFREQMNFLLGQDGDDRRLDPSSWEYRFFSPMQSVLNDDEFTASLKYPF